MTPDCVHAAGVSGTSHAYWLERFDVTDHPTIGALVALMAQERVQTAARRLAEAD